LILNGHIRKLINHFKDVSLEEILINGHKKAKANKSEHKSYQRLLMDELWPACQDLYEVRISQREMDRFERSLWETVELFKQYQHLKTEGQLLKLIQRAVHKFFTEKQRAGRISL